MNGDNPLVSVVIPAYNHEKYIKETINGIINQTYQNIELIVLDDGSKDNTVQEAEKLHAACEKRFARFYLATKPNEGTSKTLGRLIAEAKGKYIYLNASDDIAKPEAIAKLADFLERNPDYVLAVGDNEFIDKNSQLVGWDENGQETSIANAKFKTFGKYLQKNRKDIDFASVQFGSYYSLIRGNYIPNGFLFRADAVKDIIFTPEAPLEDLYIHLQLSKRGKMKYFDEPLFMYRQHATNTIKNTERMLEITRKTMLYERKTLESAENQKWREIFDTAFYQKKIKFRLGEFVSYYKICDLNTKIKILEIFGKKFIIEKHVMHHNTQ